MAGNEVTLTFGGDARQAAAAAQQAQTAVTTMADQVGATAGEMDNANQSASRFGDGLGRAGAAAAGMSAAIGDAGGTLTALDDVMNMGRNRAEAQARALNDVEQASADVEQAYGDLRQAQLDLNQSMLDGKQAGIDAEQAVIDAGQAALDAATAQTALAEASKKYGADSAEAKQAALDLAQAQADLKQANLDAEQAAADHAQATEDGSQAQRDMRQAAIDAKGAQLDLTAAQREANPSTLTGWAKSLETVTPLIMGVVGAVNLLTLATQLSTASWISNAAAQVGSKIATVASAVATGIATAAQWLWNAAFAASGIGAIIIGVTLLVGAIIYIATQTTWFQDIWRVTWAWVKDAASAAWDWLKTLPDRIGAVFGKIPSLIKTAFSGLAEIITWPFRTGFNMVSDAWNATIGKLSWTMPSIFGVGGFTIRAPKLPKFHTGGTVPGAPGSEMLAILQAGETVIPAGGSGGRTVLVIQSGGARLDDLLVEILARAVRNAGGDINVVLGSG